MAQAQYDSPSFLTRQRLALGNFTAGSGGLGRPLGLPWAIRAHIPGCVVMTAGTTSVNAMQLIVIGTYTTTTSGTNTTTTGTNTLQSVTVGTAAANALTTGSDCSVTINAGSVVYLKNNTDATAVYEGFLEFTLDPSASWTGV